MNPSELLLTAKKIAENHVGSGSDLNDAITKVASEQNLSKPQIERLIEETNKATFLDLLEKKGEQEFPVANYDTIKSGLVPKIEKTASARHNFESLSYSNSVFKTSIGNEHHSNDIVKVAAQNELSKEGKAYLEALEKVAHELWDNYNKLMDLETLGQKRYGSRYQDASDLVKVASIHNDQEIIQLENLEQILTKQSAVFEIIYNKLEKVAGNMIWGEMNPVRAAIQAGGSGPRRLAHAAGAVINRGFHTAVGLPLAAMGTGVKLALKGAAKLAPIAVPATIGLAARNMNAAFTIGTDAPRAVRSAIDVAKGSNVLGNFNPNVFKEALGMEKQAGLFTNPLTNKILKWGGNAMLGADALGKVTADTVGKIGPGSNILKVGSVNKEAGFMDGLQQALEFITPAVHYGAAGGPFGTIGGIAAAAAKKLGGGIALTMNKKEFEQSFDTIMKNNPELADNKKQVRGYFDVVSRHAPSLAKDPLVAESIVKNMNAFGGVDYNTVRGLRETEALGRPGPSERGLSGLSAMFGNS